MANLKKIDEQIAARRAASGEVTMRLERLIRLATAHVNAGDTVAARAALDAAIAEERRGDSVEGAYRSAKAHALESLRASIGTEHPDYRMAVTPPISKDEALEKFARFMDRHLDDGVSLDEAQRIREAGKDVMEARWLGQARSLAKVASPDKLRQFVAETGPLTWPGTFGSSPWERAWGVAAVLGFVPGVWRVEDRDGRSPYHAFDVAMATAYREARRAAEGEHGPSADRSAVPPVPTPYIHPTEAGEVGGQILDGGRSIWGVGGCTDRNAVMDAATEAGYPDLRVTDVPHMEDVLEIERLREEDELAAGRDEEQDLGR